MRRHPCHSLFFLLILLAQHAFAEADGPDYWRVHGVKTEDVLNIRRDNRATSEKIGEIPHDGECIKNLGCVGGLTLAEFTHLSAEEKKAIIKKRPRWCQIEFQGIRGWVAGRYLREGSCRRHPQSADDDKEIR